MTTEKILLSRFQFCHVRDKNTGILRLVEGPERIDLDSHEELVGDVQAKIRVFDGQWVLVHNPFNAELSDIIEGEREIRVVGRLGRFTCPFNLSGVPAISLPCGFTASGLPIGLQIAGRPFDEETILKVAWAYQESTDWHRRRPSV